MTKLAQFSAEALASHGFLGGAIQIKQPRDGYRSGVDAVFLAAAAPAVAGDSVLDLGSGAGVASFCLGTRVAGLRQSALEIQPAYAALARLNSKAIGLELSVYCGDVGNLCAQLREISFDGVFANPPYYHAGKSIPNETDVKDAAHRERVPLSVWLDCALRRLNPGGWLVFIQRADRLAEVLQGLEGRAGDIHIKPLAGRINRPASRVIVKARKGAKGPLVLCAPLIEHDGLSHICDGDDHSAEARAILRHGEALIF